MSTGLLINIVLVCLATLCVALTFYYYRINLFNDHKQNIIVFIMGMSVALWNGALAGYGFCTDIARADVHFAILIAAFDIYIFSISIWVAYIANIKGLYRWLFVASSALVSLGDEVFFGLAKLRDYYSVDGRLAYTTNFSWSVVYHWFYISFYAVIYIIIVVYESKRTQLKRKKVYIRDIILANCVMMVAAIPDTFMPLFGYKSFPSSGFGAMVSYIMMMYLSRKFNAFSMTKDNALDAIYDEANISIMVINYKGRVEFCNAFSKRLLGEIVPKKTNFKEVFDCSQEQLDVILAGENFDEHIVAKSTGISCAIKSVPSYDQYGDLYGIALIVSDATAEEKILEQQVLIDKGEELASQLVHVLSKTIDAKDHYTNGHSTRVAEYSVMIGQRIGYDDEKLRLLEYAALLHDVGKIGVPDEVINKDGKLTDKEFAQIKKHPEIGGEILSEIKSIPEIEVGARWHHERYGGGGYPDNKIGQEIKEVARIIGVADAYDAMASDRSYRKCLPQDVVRSEIEKGKNSQFDPVFADVMLSIIDEDTDYKLHG